MRLAEKSKIQESIQQLASKRAGPYVYQAIGPRIFGRYFVRIIRQGQATDVLALKPIIDRQSVSDSERQFVHCRLIFTTEVFGYFLPPFLDVSQRLIDGNLTS